MQEYSEQLEEQIKLLKELRDLLNKGLNTTHTIKSEGLPFKVYGVNEGRDDLATYATVQQRMKEAEMRIQVGAAKAFEEDTKAREKLRATQVPTESPAYDWWQLANGQYAKIYRTELTGEVFHEDGRPGGVTVSWNPLSSRCIQDTKFDMMRRKTGDNPKGWPEWIK